MGGQQAFTRLIAIRHGETAWNRDARIQGHTDIPLSPTGQLQAQQLAHALLNEGIDVIYTSDLLRASQTAQALADVLQLPINEHIGLRERHFGQFEGLTHQEIMDMHPLEGLRWRQREPTYGPENGEVLQAFYDRVVKTSANLAAQHIGQTIVLVAHGGVLDCLYRVATQVRLDAQRTWQINNASINRLLWSEGVFSLINWGNTEHLSPHALDEISERNFAR